MHAHSDYYPFGSVMEERTGSAEGYRFGFQGQETDDEVYGGENAVSFKYRVHDARIGKFLSIDPLEAKYPFYSPYTFSGNRVIDAVELEGLEPTRVVEDENGNMTLGVAETPSDNTGPTTSEAIAEYYLNEVVIEARREQLRVGSISQGPDPGPLEEWGQSVERGEASFVSEMAYDSWNSVWIGLQDLTPGLGTPRNLSGRHVTGSERGDGVQGVTELALGPLIKVGEGLANSTNYVYRAISAEDFENLMASRGIRARNPYVNIEPQSHVAGKRSSNWISATWDPSIAVNKYGGGDVQNVIRIDLDFVETRVIDLSNGIPGVRGRLSDYTRADKEVLIEGSIPARAINWGWHY